MWYLSSSSWQKGTLYMGHMLQTSLARFFFKANDHPVCYLNTDSLLNKIQRINTYFSSTLQVYSGRDRGLIRIFLVLCKFIQEETYRLHVKITVSCIKSTALKPLRFFLVVPNLNYRMVSLYRGILISSTVRGRRPRKQMT